MERKAFFILLLGYLGIALIGSILLMLPIARRGDLCFTDAFFTSVSALCVTGLIVRDTPVFFTIFGKSVILALIQLGGIGYMTLAGLYLHRMRRHLILPEIISQGFPELKPGFALYFAKRVVLYTIVIEFIGMLLLFLGFSKYYEPGYALGHALFQSISAFCNAGFSTFSDSLVSFKSDIFINLVVMSLIILGGLGFFVLDEMNGYVKYKFKLLKERPSERRREGVKTFKFSTHTKAVFFWSLILTLGGAVIIFALENQNAFAGFTNPEKFIVSLFQSVTTRTCGFNTVNFATLSYATLVFVMLLMFIGGSPGGTAGGVKTNTFGLIFVWLFHHLRGYKNVYLYKRKISEITVQKAFIIVIIATVVLFLCYFLILAVDRNAVFQHNPLKIAFEVVSAFGTVGLSVGSVLYDNVSLSADFNVLSKWIIIFLMLVGKVGVLSLATYMVEKAKVEIGYPEDKYIVG